MRDVLDATTPPFAEADEAGPPETGGEDAAGEGNEPEETTANEELGVELAMTAAVLVFAAAWVVTATLGPEVVLAWTGSTRAVLRLTVSD